MCELTAEVSGSIGQESDKVLPVARRYVLLIPVMILISNTATLGYVIWPASSIEKIFRDTPARHMPTKGLKLYGARNEHIAGQLVISAQEKPLSQVEVAMSPLRHSRGYELSPQAVSLSLVKYVYLGAHDRDYPDPLAPLRPFDVKAGQNQPVWLAWVIPKDTPPGPYKGRVTVSAENEPAHTIPISVNIWNFTLPDEPIVRNAFTLSGPILEYEGVADGSAQASALVKRYYEFLLERRISVRDLPVALDSPEAAPYLSDPRLSSYRIRGEGNVEPGLIDRLEQHGWLDKAYIRVVDEPKKAERFAKIHQIGKAMRASHPDLRQLVCFNRKVPGEFAGGKPFWKLADNSVQIWCPFAPLFSDPAVREAMAQRAEAGDEVWWYVCCSRRPPYPNFLTDCDGIEPRIVFWQMWKYRVVGILYWGVVAWRSGDPWENPAGRVDKYPERYGDGMLLYPGKTVGVFGPVTSFRLENIRDGIEDYQYLYLLACKSGSRQVSDKRVDGVVKSLETYTREAATLDRVRNHIGRLLSR